MLLRKLHQPDFLSQVSHVIVDEVHERQVRCCSEVANVSTRYCADLHSLYKRFLFTLKYKFMKIDIFLLTYYNHFFSHYAIYNINHAYL